MEEQEFIDFIDKAYAKGRAIEDVTKKLKDSGFDQTYIDLAERHYDSKKKVKTEPAKGSELPSMPGEKTTSSAPKSAGRVTDLNEALKAAEPIPAGTKVDVPIGASKPQPFQERAVEVQDTLPEEFKEKAAAVKTPKMVKEERESLAFSISETISKDKMDMDELSRLYYSYKSKAPELDGVELFDESGQINKTFIDVVSSDYESYYNKSLAEILKKEGVKTEGPVASAAKFLGLQLLGFVALGEQLLKESGGSYRRSAAEELAYEELEKAGYAPKAGMGPFTPPSIQKITSEYAEERGKVGMLKQLEKGYSIEQITKGAMQTAIQDGDWGLVGMAMIEQIPQLIYPIISKKHGIKILSGMAAGGSYADVIDDEDFGAYKTTYAVLMGLAEGLTSKIGMTDVNQVRRLLGDTSKEALEKSVISKTLLKWIPDTGFSGIAKSGVENAFEESLVGLVDEGMKVLIAGKEFNPINIAEGAMIGGSFGMSVHVATKGLSALLRSTMSKDYIKIKDRIGQINELLKDESISETEREILAKELGKYKSDIRKMENDTQKFYEGFSKEDVQETVRLNQRINDGLESYKGSKTQIAKEAALRSVKEAVEAKKNIEGKYTAEPSVSVAGRVKSIKVGSKVTSANVNMIIDGFSGFIDRLSPETFGVSKTTADQAKRGLKSIKNVVESFVKEGKEVDIVVHQDAESFVEATGEKESRGIHITKDGAANQIHLLAPALKDNTVYHEAIHEAIPNIYGKSGVDKLAEKFFNALKANPELFVKLSGFLAQYKSGEVMDWTKLNDAQKDELITELGAMIASGDIDVEVKSSIGSAFVSAITELMGKMGFNVKPTTQQLVNALNFVSNNLATGKAVGEARARKTAGTKGDVATSEEGTKKQEILRRVKKWQYIGENANLTDDVRGNLQSARGLEALKEDPKTILLATGWERGVDGKWRYEIPDNVPALKDVLEIVREFISENKSYSASQKANYFLPEELLSLYPDLKNVTIFFNKEGNENEGSYDPVSKTINVNLGVYPKKTVSVLLHEIQHAIQDIEGFAKGGNPNKAGFDKYEKFAGEVEARNVQARMEMTPEERRLKSMQETEDVARDEQVVFFSTEGIMTRLPKEQAVGDDVESTAKALEGKDEAVSNILVPNSSIKQKVYHGSEMIIVGDFRKMNPNIDGFFFSSDIDNAKTYGKNIVEAYVDVKNPLVIDATGLKFTDDIPVTVIASYPGEAPYETVISMPIDEIAYMVKNGKRNNQLIEIKDREKYDGIVFKNLIDPSLSSRREIPQDTIVAFENSQIKRADTNQLAEAYHKAKADGSNPELVKAVESLLSKEQTKQDAKVKDELAEDGAPVSKNIDNPSELISKKRQGYGNELVNIEIEHTEKNKLEQYEKEGIVRYVDDLSFLKDAEVVTITPDDMAVSTIKKNGKTIHETGGGVFFVLKYRDIWAFSNASVAKSVTRVINEQVEKNGVSYLVLVKGTDSKMMSSPQGAKAALLAVEALSDAGIVSAKDLAIAFEKAVAASNGNFVIPDNESAIKSAIENYFEDPTQSTFQRRGDVVRQLISEIGKTKTGKANAKEIQKFFGGDASKKLSFSNSKNWDDGGSELLKNLIGRMFAEPITHGLEKSSLYAVIPITSKVEFFKSSHKSYPFHLRFEDLKTKPTLVIPKDRPRGDDYMTSIGGGTAKELGKSFPGAVLGDISKGWGQGVVKPPVKSEGKKKAQAITPETSANYANMTEDGKGNFVFYHFSDQNFDAPDPNMAGKNKRGVTSREEASAMNTAGAVAMYYTDAMDREGLISADYGYEVRVPIERVYDIDADPLSLEKEAMERFKKENPNLGFSGNHRAFAMTAIAAEKGFDMTVGAWTKGLSRAHSAVKLPVSDRMINKGKEKKKFNETFESNKGSWVAESPDRAMGPVKDVYTKISMERSETNNYDDLYRLYYEYRNYSQQEITDMINSSDVSSELKSEYKKALDAVPSGYQSVKKQGADKKRSQGFLETEAKLYLLDMSDYDEATNSFKPKMTEDDFVGLMSMTLTEQTARDVYRSVKDGSGISDIVGQAYANYLQDIEKLNERDRITMANIDKWLLDSQADLKKVLKDAGLANAYSLLVTRAGHGSIAKFFYNQYEKDVYNGLNKEEVEELDKIIFARRVIQIDTNFDNRGEKRPDHPLGMNKESALVSLKASEVRNKADFNRLNQRADAYFDAFRAMLLRAKENELINEDDYNHFVNFDYQPRFFLSHLFEDFDSLPSDMRVSTNKELIAKIKSGSQESAMMDSRFLMAAYASSMEARIAKNKVNKSLSEAAVGNKNSEWIREDGTKDTRGFQEITYFDDGVKKKFYLRNDLKNALDNVPLSSPEFSRGASILSGSAFLKVAATAINPLFVLKNIPRDFNHVLFLTDTYDNSILPVSAFKLTMDFMKGWGSAKDSQNELYKDWILHGGGMEFLAVQGKPNLTSRAGKAISDAFSYLGEKSEMSFRIGVYSRQLDRAKQKYKDLNNGKEATGRDLEEIKVEAARQSREIIDFAQGGSFIKAAEAYTPYINAAFQGFRVSKNYIKENPLMFGAKLAQAFIGLTGLALLNLSYDDDDITDINEEIRRRNFILLLPFKIKNEKGELQRAYIPIAKTQQLQAFLNPLEQMSYKLAAEINGKEPIDYYSKELLDISVGEVLESFLPVNPTDLADLYTRVPMANAVYKYNTNYDKFRKQEISYDYGKVEPKMEGINDKTVPYFYKAFSQITGMSPKRLQAGVESVITSPNSSLPVGMAYFLADASSRMVNVPYKGEYQEIDMRDASFPALTGLLMSTRKVAIRTIDPNTTPSGLKDRLRSINEVAGSSRKEINFLADKITEEMRKEEYSQEAFKKWRDEAVKLLGTVAKKSPTEIKYAESVLMNSLKKKKYDRAFDEIKYSTNHVARAKVLDEIIKSGGFKDLAELEKEMYYSGNGYKIPQETYYEYKKITK
jgi:hypothetical protein